MAVKAEAAKKIEDRMIIVVNQIRENPSSITDRDRYAFGIWAMENNALGLVSTKLTDRFIEIVCPDYWELYQAGVRGEV